MSFFEGMTGAKLKDCFIDHHGTLVFIVEERKTGKARVLARRLEELLKKRIKIVEFHPNVERFIVNFIYPLKVIDMKSDQRLIDLHVADSRTKGYLIGRDNQNLIALNEVVGRYFGDLQIRVK